jgi:hypothetical protein
LLRAVVRHNDEILRNHQEKFHHQYPLDLHRQQFRQYHHHNEVANTKDSLEVVHPDGTPAHVSESMKFFAKLNLEMMRRNLGIPRQMFRKVLIVDDEIRPKPSKSKSHIFLVMRKIHDLIFIPDLFTSPPHSHTYWLNKFKKPPVVRHENFFPIHQIPQAAVNIEKTKKDEKSHIVKKNLSAEKFGNDKIEMNEFYKRYLADKEKHDKMKTLGKLEIELLPTKVTKKSTNKPATTEKIVKKPVEKVEIILKEDWENERKKLQDKHAPSLMIGGSVLGKFLDSLFF